MLPEFKNEPFLDFTKDEIKKKMKDALQKVKAELGKEYPLIIDGKEVRTGKKLKSINPARPGEVVGEVHLATKDEVEKAMEAAWKAFEEWKRVPAWERAGVLLKAAKILRERRYEFNAWLCYEIGKTWPEADGETAEAIDFLEFYAREAIRYSQIEGVTPLEGEFNELRYIPLGAGVVIPPWNFGLSILCGMTSAAIVTGNTVILKPSSDSPVIGYKFAEIMYEAGLPDGVLNFLPGKGAEVGDTLTSHPKTRFIAFTGSKDVGLRIVELAGKTSPGQIWIKRVIAEMGGKDAIIVDDEADLEDAVKGVVASAYGYSGQKCSACSRLILLESIYDKFIDMLVEATKKIKVDYPEKEDTFMGPVINERAEKKILGYIEVGKKEGKLILGGNKIKDLEGYFIEPTIFKDVDENARIAQEEIFGPVLAIIKAKDFDDALRIANNTIYGLTGSVYTKNRMKIAKAKEEFHCGNLYINRKCTGALVGAHPFGGFNMSGTDSKAGGKDYLLLFLQAKAISERL